MSDGCPVCGGATIQKSRPRLLVAGLVLLAAAGLPRFSAWLWLPAILAILTGLYLVYWATAGKGRWCRQCKAIRIPHDSHSP